MSEWKIRFGTAGISDSFTVMGYKNSLDIPAYTEKMGLDAFEYLLALFPPQPSLTSKIIFLVS